MKRLRLFILIAVAAVMAVVLFCTIMAPQWRMADNEASTIAALRHISGAQELYNNLANGRYGTFQELGAHIDPLLAEATTPDHAKDGYYFCCVHDNWKWWCCVARPAVWGVTGERNFEGRSDGLIYYNETEDSSEFKKKLGE